MFYLSGSRFFVNIARISRLAVQVARASETAVPRVQVLVELQVSKCSTSRHIQFYFHPVLGTVSCGSARCHGLWSPRACLSLLSKTTWSSHQLTFSKGFNASLCMSNIPVHTSVCPQCDILGTPPSMELVPRGESDLHMQASICFFDRKPRTATQTQLHIEDTRKFSKISIPSPQKSTTSNLSWYDFGKPTQLFKANNHTGQNRGGLWDWSDKAVYVSPCSSLYLINDTQNYFLFLWMKICLHKRLRQGQAGVRRVRRKLLLYGYLMSMQTLVPFQDRHY